MINALDEFVKCLHEKRYYDAHEKIEALWFPKRFTESNEVKLLKGFINAAVSFELHKRGRFDSSKRVWKNYLKYRPLLYKIESVHLKKYHSVARYIENTNKNINKKAL